MMVEVSERGVAFWRLAFEDHCELCEMLFREVTAMMKRTMSHLLRELAKLKIPLVGSVRL